MGHKIAADRQSLRSHAVFPVVRVESHVGLNRRKCLAGRVILTHDRHHFSDGLNTAQFLKTVKIGIQCRMFIRLAVPQFDSGQIIFSVITHKTGDADLFERGEVSSPDRIGFSDVVIIFFPHSLLECLAAYPVRIVITHLVEQFIAKKRILSGITHRRFEHLFIHIDSGRIKRVIGDHMSGIKHIAETPVGTQRIITGMPFVFQPEINVIGKKTVDMTVHPRHLPPRNLGNSVFQFRTVKGIDLIGVAHIEIHPQSTHDPRVCIRIKRPAAQQKNRFTVFFEMPIADPYLADFRIKAVFTLKFFRQNDFFNGVGSGLFFRSCFFGGSLRTVYHFDIAEQKTMPGRIVVKSHKTYRRGIGFTICDMGPACTIKFHSAQIKRKVLPLFFKLNIVSVGLLILFTEKHLQCGGAVVGFGFEFQYHFHRNIPGQLRETHSDMSPCPDKVKPHNFFTVTFGFADQKLFLRIIHDPFRSRGEFCYRIDLADVFRLRFLSLQRSCV